MDERVITIFKGEILKQCEFVHIAIKNIELAANQLEQQGASEHLWYHVQSFLISSANVSKLIWGSKHTEKLRQSLRDHLEIDENKFFKIRELRNDFEHFDERIERWFNNSKNRNFIDSNIGPTDFMTGGEPSDYMRNFDTDKLAVTFNGKEYLFQPVIDEISALYQSLSS